MFHGKRSHLILGVVAAIARQIEILPLRRVDPWVDPLLQDEVHCVVRHLLPGDVHHGGSHKLFAGERRIVAGGRDPHIARHTVSVRPECAAQHAPARTQHSACTQHRCETVKNSRRDRATFLWPFFLFFSLPSLSRTGASFRETTFAS
eukprot:3335200-Pyramimonas_sp.AAC.1